jgi:hypothetical protein
VSLFKLRDWPLPNVRVSCKVCKREGQVSKEKLGEKYGLDEDMFSIREALTLPTCGRTNQQEPCSAILADALLVDAIFEPDVAKVLKPELLPEAREWRTKLGIEVLEYNSGEEK